jgi:uroporphyrinogen-III synthase
MSRVRAGAVIVRVLVTRSVGQGEATAGELFAMGHQAVLAPVLEIASTGTPAPPGRFDAVILTSQNAVAALATERARFEACPVLAVGARTAGHLRQAGFGQVAEADGDSLALVNLAKERCPPGARLLHAAGQERKSEPARSLLASGYDVVIWECYVARPTSRLSSDAVEALRSGKIDAVLHYSRRSAESFAHLARRAGLGEALAGTAHLCLSPDVAKGLDTLVGLKLLIAPRPDEAALLGLLFTVSGAQGSRAPQSRC